MNRTLIDWSKADWDKQDMALSLEYGCSREAVRQARIRNGGGKALRPRQRVLPGTREHLASLDTSGMDLKQLAVLVGCSERRVADLLKGLGKTFKRRPKGNALYDWGKIPMDWAMRTDKELAAIVGVPSPAVVTQWRNRHGMKKASHVVLKARKARVSRVSLGSRVSRVQEPVLG